MPDFQIAKLQQVLARIDRRVDAAGEAFRGQIDNSSRLVRGAFSALVRGASSEQGLLKRRPVIRATSTANAIHTPFLRTVERAIDSLALVATDAGQIIHAARVGGSVNRQMVTAVSRTMRIELTNRLDKLVSDVYGVLQAGQASGQSAEEVVTEVNELIDAYVTFARSNYETALMTFAQSLVTRQTTPHAAYLYLGPIDARIRPFCLKNVGKVWTKDRIDQMDNGITGNTFLRRGGPNCRHLWIPAPADVVQFANTGKVVTPGLVDDLAFAAREVGIGIRRTA